MLGFAGTPVPLQKEALVGRQHSAHAVCSSHYGLYSSCSPCCTTVDPASQPWWQAQAHGATRCSQQGPETGFLHAMAAQPDACRHQCCHARCLAHMLSSYTHALTHSHSEEYGGQLEYDVGNLCAWDPSPVDPGAYTGAERESRLLDTARAMTQVISGPCTHALHACTRLALLGGSSCAEVRGVVSEVGAAG